MSRGGRAAFRRWLAEHQLSFSEGDTDEAVFRYGRRFDDAVGELPALTRKQRNIYLCEIVEYSSVLFQETSDLVCDPAGATYCDVEQLLDEPFVRGFDVDTDILGDAISGIEGWVVVCGGYSFDETCAEAGFTQRAVVPALGDSEYAEPIFFGALSNPDQFSRNWTMISFPVYFLRPDATVEQDLFAQCFEEGRLTELLIRRGVTFGTMGQCHVDDDIACSYRGAVYKFPQRLLRFVR